MTVVREPHVNGATPAKQVPIYDATGLLSHRVRKWQPPSSLAPISPPPKSRYANNAVKVQSLLPLEAAPGMISLLVGKRHASPDTRCDAQVLIVLVVRQTESGMLSLFEYVDYAQGQ